MHWGMMMTSDKNDMSDQLSQLFDDARACKPGLSPHLRARILADANACNAGLAPQRQRFAPWRNWFSGWAVPGLAGGAMVAVAGFWIGVAMPMPVVALDAPDWMQNALGYMDLIALQLIGVDDPLLMEF